LTEIFISFHWNSTPGLAPLWPATTANQSNSVPDPPH
jgi:hypothetical protein